MEERFSRIETSIMLKNIADNLRHLRVDGVEGDEVSRGQPQSATPPSVNKTSQPKKRQSSQQQAALLRNNLAKMSFPQPPPPFPQPPPPSDDTNRDRLTQELINMGFRPEVAHYGAQNSKATRADDAAQFLIQQKPNIDSSTNYRNLMSIYGSLDNIQAAPDCESDAWLSGASTSSETSTVPSRPASPALRSHRAQSPRISQVIRSTSPRTDQRSQAPKPMYSPYSANTNYLYGPSFSKNQPNKLTYIKYPQIPVRRDNDNTALLPPRVGPVMGCHHFCNEQYNNEDPTCYSDSDPIPYDSRYNDPVPYDNRYNEIVSYNDIREDSNSPCETSPPPNYTSNPSSNRSSIGPNDLPPYEFAPINPPPCIEQTTEGKVSVSEAVKKINENIAQNVILSPKPVKKSMAPAKVSKSKKPPKKGENQSKSETKQTFKIFSPLPRRKAKPEVLKEVDKIVPKLPAQSPTAVKFYLEQHIENLIKETEKKKKRREVFEEGIANCSAKEQQVARKKFSKEESNFLRLKRTKINKDMFNKMQTIGIGSFGEVCLVQKKDDGNLYAMKTLRKVEVWKRNQTAHVKAERDILSEADNEWVVKLHFSFQDKDNLYFVMDYVPGGDMMSLLIKCGKFPEYVAKYYIAELICAVESVHKLKFVHRDIKPDNILIDAKGHLKLTDFGLCTGFRWTHESSRYHSKNAHDRQGSIDFDEEAWKKMKQKCQCGDRLNHSKPLDRRRAHQRCLAHSLVGTPNYIAPEVLLRQLYHFECDWWSVGVILYEMIIGRPPFLQSTPADTQLSIINWRSTLSIPRCVTISTGSIDLIFQLLQDAPRRLGQKGAEEIKSHLFFEDIDWDNQHNTAAPFIPDIKFPTDTQYFDTFDEDRVRFSDIEDSSDTDLPDHPFYEFTFRRFENAKPTEEKRERGPVFV